MEKNSKIALAAIAGAVVGAGIALLFAPASGKETRGKLGEKINDLKDKLKNKADTFENVEK